jgi:hypothetical protein
MLKEQPTHLKVSSGRGSPKCSAATNPNFFMGEGRGAIYVCTSTQEHLNEVFIIDENSQEYRSHALVVRLFDVCAMP